MLKEQSYEWLSYVQITWGKTGEAMFYTLQTLGRCSLGIEAKSLFEEIMHNKLFQVKNFKGNNMYSVAFELVLKYLNSNSIY